METNETHKELSDKLLKYISLEEPSLNSIMLKFNAEYGVGDITTALYTLINEGKIEVFKDVYYRLTTTWKDTNSNKLAKINIQTGVFEKHMKHIKTLKTWKDELFKKYPKGEILKDKKSKTNFFFKSETDATKAHSATLQNGQVLDVKKAKKIAVSKFVNEGFNDHDENITINTDITVSQFKAAYLEKNPMASIKDIETAILDFDDWMQNTFENAGINFQNELDAFLNQ